VYKGACGIYKGRGVYNDGAGGGGIDVLFLNYFENSQMLPEVKDENFIDTINLDGADFFPSYFDDKQAIRTYSGSDNQTFYRSKSKNVTKENIKVTIIGRGTDPIDLSATGFTFNYFIIQFLGRELYKSNFIRVIVSNADKNKPIVDNTGYISALDDSNRIARGILEQPTTGWKKIELVYNIKSFKFEIYLNSSLQLSGYLKNNSVVNAIQLRLYKETYTYKSVWSMFKVEQF
jgi:hypothetical protein